MPPFFQGRWGGGGFPGLSLINVKDLKVEGGRKEAEVGVGDQYRYSEVRTEVESDFRGCEDGIREGRDSEEEVAREKNEDSIAAL